MHRRTLRNQHLVSANKDLATGLMFGLLETPLTAEPVSGNPSRDSEGGVALATPSFSLQLNRQAPDGLIPIVLFLR